MDSYDERDYVIIATNILNRLCEDREPRWYDIGTLAKEIKYNNKTGAARLAAAILLKMQYIGRDSQTNNVRLAPLGRKNCGRDIEISDLQKLRTELHTS
jgi:hypothetical protein